jgi:hypothetical protein
VVTISAKVAVQPKSDQRALINLDVGNVDETVGPTF